MKMERLLKRANKTNYTDNGREFGWERINDCVVICVFKSLTLFLFFRKTFSIGIVFLDSFADFSHGVSAKLLFDIFFCVRARFFPIKYIQNFRNLLTYRHENVVVDKWILVLCVSQGELLKASFFLFLSFSFTVFFGINAKMVNGPRTIGIRCWNKAWNVSIGSGNGLHLRYHRVFFWNITFPRHLGHWLKWTKNC